MLQEHSESLYLGEKVQQIQTQTEHYHITKISSMELHQTKNI